MFATLAAATVAGCSSSGSSGKSQKSTTTSTPKGFNLTTDEGQVSVSFDGKLPPGWPNGFPVPANAEAAGSGSLTGTSKSVMVGVYTTSESPQQVYDFYKNNSQLTVTESSSFGGGNAFVGTVKLGGTYRGAVTIVTLGGKTAIVVTLETAGTTGSAPASSTS